MPRIGTDKRAWSHAFSDTSDPGNCGAMPTSRYRSGTLPRSSFLDHFRVAGRVFPSFNQPTCTASIETEPLTFPVEGVDGGSDRVRVPAT